MAKARKKQPEEISVRIVCESQDFDTSISINRRYPKHDNHPFSHLRGVRLEGKIVEPSKFRWIHGIVDIWPSDFTPETVKKLDDFGFVETKGTVLRARAFWPSESFPDIVSAVAAKRILEMRVTISPIKYRSAAVLGLSFDTRSNEDFEKEFLFWNGPHE
jgi:hypothetical protein